MKRIFSKRIEELLYSSAKKIAIETLKSDPINIEFIKLGMMNHKCRVRTNCGQDIIIRFYPESRSYLINQEPDIISRCRDFGLPVPELIADSRSGPAAPLNYLVYRRIEGDTLLTALPNMDKLTRAFLAKDLASTLSKFSEISFDGAGEIKNKIKASENSWSLFSERAMTNGLKAIKKENLLESNMIDDIENAIDFAVSEIPSHQNKLIWGDINFSNIIVSKKGEVAGLIDFEGCLSGDPLATLGYASAAHGTDPFFSQILSSWPTIISGNERKLIPFYALLRVLRLAPYGHLPLPTGRPRDNLKIIFPGLLSALKEINITHQ